MPDKTVEILAVMFLSLVPGCLLARTLLGKQPALHWALLLPLGIALLVPLNGLLWVVASALSVRVTGIGITLAYAAATLACLAFLARRIAGAPLRLERVMPPMPRASVVLLLLGLVASAFVGSLFMRRSAAGYTSMYVPLPEKVLQQRIPVGLTRVPILIESREAEANDYRVEIRSREGLSLTQWLGTVEPGALIELELCFEATLESLERWEVMLLRDSEEAPYRTLILWLPAASLDTDCTSSHPSAGG